MGNLIRTTIDGVAKDVEVNREGDMLLNVVFAKSRAHVRGLQNLSISWYDLAVKFSETVRTGETMAQYHVMSKDDQTKVKDVGGIISGQLRDGHRSKGSVEAARLIMLDFDKGAGGALADIWGNFCTWENTGFVHSTHSHTEAANRFRIMIPLKRPVSPAEYAAIGKELVRRLGANDVVDTSTYQPERIMFFPSTPKDGPYVFDYAGGDIIDPSEILADIAANGASMPVSKKRDKPKSPAEDPAQKPGIIGAFCSIYSVDEAITEFLDGVYTPCEERPGYYTYVAGTTAGGLFVRDGLYGYSHHSTDPANTGHEHNAFDLVRIHKFGALDTKAKPDTAITKLPSFKAMAKYARELATVNEEFNRKQRDRAAAEYDAIEAAPGAARGKSYQKVLSELLSQIEYVDFRQKARLDADVKITQKVYVIVSVDRITDVAVSRNWGLCTKNGFIYVFNGSYWQAIDEDDFKTFLGKAAIKMGAPALDAKHYKFKDELYKQFLSTANLPTPDAKTEVLINLANGTFEISDSKQRLREPRREDFIKYRLPFEYDPAAVCPLFDAYLTRVLPDDNCRMVLAEYMGYIFTNGLKLEKAAILYGSGANGKSVFFDIVNALLGEDNTCSYSLQNLTKYDGYQRAELSNKLLNYASEINGHLEASIFKQLVSGEPVEARKIYGDPFIMRDYGKLMFNCNALPKEVEQTDAYFRRFLIFPFTQTIPEGEQDPELSKKIIAAELSGVFNWVLYGLRRLLQQKGFTKSDVMRDQISNYRKESDSVALFIEDEGYAPDINENIPLKEMYDEYRSYCIDNGNRPVASRKMTERLRILGFEAERKNIGRVIYAKK